jgi:hypothetical protein
MGARNQVGIVFSYRAAARLHRLAELIPWNQFLGSLKVLKYRFKEGEDVLSDIRPEQNSIGMGRGRGVGTGNNSEVRQG